MIRLLGAFVVGLVTGVVAYVAAVELSFRWLGNVDVMPTTPNPDGSQKVTWPASIKWMSEPEPNVEYEYWLFV